MEPTVELFIDEEAQFYDNTTCELIIGIKSVRTIVDFTQVVTHEYTHFTLHKIGRADGNEFLYLKYDNIDIYVESWIGLQ